MLGRSPVTGRKPGLSLRLKLMLSYAAFVMVAGLLLVSGVWVFLMSALPDVTASPDGILDFRVIFLRSYLPAAAATLAFLLIFGLLGGWFLAGRMLAPLTRITDATRRAAEGSLSHRIALKGRSDELRELADSFDGMLSRLEAHDAEQQRFAANASHELRTPLAITQTLLDIARKDPDREGSELDERLRAVNARAIELTEALLLLSRTEQGSFVRDGVDLSLMAEEAAETLLPLAEKHGVVIEVSGGVAPTSGSPALLLQLAMNLAQNAIIHNLPGGGTVEIRTSVGPQFAELVVENTGEQLSAQLVATLAEPFQRGTERARSDHAGIGLGLAIAKRIAQAHDGTLSLSPRAGGGLRAVVQVPVLR